jgi:hypothetical protein
MSTTADKQAADHASGGAPGKSLSQALSRLGHTSCTQTGSETQSRSGNNRRRGFPKSHQAARQFQLPDSFTAGVGYLYCTQGLARELSALAPAVSAFNMFQSGQDNTILPPHLVQSNSY